jgi:L-threonylcarbamoyladenylate synthase
MHQMSPVIDCTSEEGMVRGVAAAAEAVRRGEVVVLPTDTVYGVGVDAFASDAVAAVLKAKGRGREMPLPVLVPNPETVDGLAANVPAYARDLIHAFWPGPLTLVLLSQSSLMWDLGETNGTVALRMPQNDTALRLLAEVGPMAVTSANLTGQPPARTVLEAATQLGSAVSVYLEAGPSAGALASTILDCTREFPVILRAGAVPAGQIQEVLGDIELGN